MFNIKTRYSNCLTLMRKTLRSCRTLPFTSRYSVKITDDSNLQQWRCKILKSHNYLWTLLSLLWPVKT